MLLRRGFFEFSNVACLVYIYLSFDFMSTVLMDHFFFVVGVVIQTECVLIVALAGTRPR
jgi:hypothetical protein